MSSPVAAPVEVGDLVADKYEVIRTLGKGGMGFVVAARHTTLDQIVAIKFLVREFGAKGEAAARFLQEARAAARIESDYVCRVFDTGVLPSGVPFLVMELLDGIDLEQEIDQRGRLPVEEAVDFTMQALDAIATAHKLGIVHRDLKPANLFLTERADGTRRLKVFDFGISQTDEGGLDHLDLQGIIGTPAYMSPEQARNATKTDHRTDIFSLGAILFEALTGRSPHAGESVSEIMHSVLKGSPIELSTLRPDLPEGLVSAVMRALSPVREARFDNAHEFARALSPYASQGFANLAQSIPVPSVSQRALVADSLRSPSSSRETVAGWTQGGLRDLYQRRRGYVAFGVAALLISGAVWIGIARSRTVVPGASQPPTAAMSIDNVPVAAAPAAIDPSVAIAATNDLPAVASLTDASASGASSGTSASSSAPTGVTSPASTARPQKMDPAAPHGLQRGKNRGNPLLENRE